MTTARVIPSTLSREVSKIVADILQEEMGLDKDHSILGDQKWDIPKDKKLFVVIFDQAAPPTGAANFMDTDQESKTFGKEIQQSNVIHDIRVEIMSYDADARLRKEEVGLALASFFAQQLSGKYGIQIGRAQSPINASDTEVTGRMLRYVIHLNITALHVKIKDLPSADFFDKFNEATEDGTIKAPEITEEI